MINLRARIVKELQDEFPQFKDSILPYYGRLDGRTDANISFNASGILVCFIGMRNAPEDKIPWEMEVSFGLCVTAAQDTATKRDEEGWLLTCRVAKFVHSKCWGFDNGIEITPARILAVDKDEVRRPDGRLTGVNYWVILISQLAQFEVLTQEA